LYGLDAARPEPTSLLASRATKCRAGRTSGVIGAASRGTMRAAAGSNSDNRVPMNFALILFLATLVTGAVALADRLVFSRSRDAGAQEPWWVEYPKSFFPVLLIVFLLRSFLAEPFKIPSSSMRPTLEVGDFILVNKFSYGIRLPIVEKKIVPLGDPQRGDVVVFRYPINPSQDFIKRVVGVGGDEVVYRDKRLTVNGKPWPLKADGTYSYLEGLRFETTERLSETVDTGNGTKLHDIAWNPQAPAVFPPNVRPFPARENCDYNEHGFSCRVPPGEYFMMGDNRDNSDDSRYWGFVPDDHIRGRAFFIWFNWDDIASLAFRRVGSGIR
jgi:signal peptidase I